jgi:hypothetical protein
MPTIVHAQSPFGNRKSTRAVRRKRHISHSDAKNKNGDE